MTMAKTTGEIVTVEIEVRLADYAEAADAGAIAELMDAYARDAMGGGKALAEGVPERIAATLARYPTAFSVLARFDGQAAGLINCFESLSTFKCQPLVNIHDVVVAPACRGRGVAQAMLAAVEAEARRRGCCKLTLEVLQGNHPARTLYEKFGFAGYELDPALGHALFWEKALV